MSGVFGLEAGFREVLEPAGVGEEEADSFNTRRVCVESVRSDAELRGLPRGAIPRTSTKG